MKRALKNTVYFICLFVLHLLDLIVDTVSYTVFAIAFKLGMSGATGDKIFFSTVDPVVELLVKTITKVQKLKKKNK